MGFSVSSLARRMGKCFSGLRVICGRLPTRDRLVIFSLRGLCGLGFYDAGCRLGGSVVGFGVSVHSFYGTCTGMGFVSFSRFLSSCPGSR